MCPIGTRVIVKPDSRPPQQKSIFVNTQAFSEEPLTGSFTELCEDRFSLTTQAVPSHPPHEAVRGRCG